MKGHLADLMGNDMIKYVSSNGLSDIAYHDRPAVCVTISMQYVRRHAFLEINPGKLSNDTEELFI
jgi:hypothetical protein